jgi:hypothetical protein
LLRDKEGKRAPAGKGPVWFSVKAEAARARGYAGEPLNTLIANENLFRREGMPMRLTRLCGMMGLVSLLVLQLAGCASSMKITSQKLCQGAGGTYANGLCTPGTKSVKALEQCEANGGLYLAGEDACQLQPVRH